METSTSGGDEVIAGVLERIVYHNSENHFCIGEFRLSDRRGQVVSIHGNLPAVQCGETLRLHGYWNQHPSHGRQFRFKRFESTLPATVHGIRKYLGSGLVPGIGKAMAERIVDKFGTETLRILQEESVRLREVPGIGKQRAIAIKQAWDEQQAVRDLMIFLQTYGVGSAQCLKLIQRYGGEARQVLEQDPYRMVGDIAGIGFHTADRIARNVNVSNDSSQRLAAGIVHVMQTCADEGSSAVSSEHLLAKSAELLQVEEDLLRTSLEQLAQQKDLLLTDGDVWQLPVLARAEQSIADDVERLSGQKTGLPSIRIDAAIVWAQERAHFRFAERQCQAIDMALANTCSLLTGGPGTGKTTILRALVDILQAKKVKVVLAAPTGRAAQRMGESTGHSAQTLHRLLRFDPAGGGFTVNRSSPLRADFLIVDECSMLDTQLASVLLRAIPNGCHVLLVGDRNQLPSVGPGCVFSDLLGSRVWPSIELDQVFRQGERSEIVATAHAILQGQEAPPFVVDSLDDLDPQRDLAFVRAADPQQCLDKVLEVCARQAEQRYQLHPVRDVQVLAPLHKGTGGVANLNQNLRRALNPRARQASAQAFVPGDKVIQTRNNYDKGVFNGDLGMVMAVQAADGTTEVRFDGQTVSYSRGELNEVQQAWAITIHKSQGSEFPMVIIPLLKQHFILLQRNLLYTGITRGRRKVIVIGDPAAWALAVRNQDAGMRRTGLPIRLRERNLPRCP